MGQPVAFAPVDNLAAALRLAGVRSVEQDPAKLLTPGVWIKHAGFSFEYLDGYTHKLQLHLVVADNGYVRSRDALAELLNLVTAVVDPTDDPFFQGLILPSSPAPLPGLVVPFDLAP